MSAILSSSVASMCAFSSPLLCPLKPSELDEPSLTFLPIPLHVGLHLHAPFW